MSTTYNTLFVGKVRLHYSQLASTNLKATELVSKSKPSEGTVISTYNQYGGRGQIGSKWESEANKNITISLILYPRFLMPRHQFLLNQAVALAICDFISPFIKEKVKIKWPNDIYVGKKKISGILIQNQLSGSCIQSSVIGIGINVNQSVFLSDAPNPTSLILETGNHNDPDLLIQQLCWALEVRYLQLRSGKSIVLKEDYLGRLFRMGEEAKYLGVNGEIFTGTITGVSDTGKLQIEHNQRQETFDLKEIQFLL